MPNALYVWLRNRKLFAAEAIDSSATFLVFSGNVKNELSCQP